MVGGSSTAPSATAVSMSPKSRTKSVYASSPSKTSQTHSAMRGEASAAFFKSETPSIGTASRAMASCAFLGRVRIRRRTLTHLSDMPISSAMALFVVSFSSFASSSTPSASSTLFSCSRWMFSTRAIVRALPLVLTWPGSSLMPSSFAARRRRSPARSMNLPPSIGLTLSGSIRSLAEMLFPSLLRAFGSKLFRALCPSWTTILSTGIIKGIAVAIAVSFWCSPPPDAGAGEPAPAREACDHRGGAGSREGGELEAPLDRLAAHRAGAQPCGLTAVVGEHHRQLGFGLEARLDEEAATVAVARVVVDEDLAADPSTDQDALLLGEAVAAEFV